MFPERRRCDRRPGSVAAEALGRPNTTYMDTARRWRIHFGQPPSVASRGLRRQTPSKEPLA